MFPPAACCAAAKHFWRWVPQVSRAFEEEALVFPAAEEEEGADEEEALSASTAALRSALPRPINGSTIQASGSSRNNFRNGVTSSPRESKASRLREPSEAAIDERRQETASRHSAVPDACLPSAAATSCDGFHCGLEPPLEASRTAARVSGLRGSSRRR